MTVFLKHGSTISKVNLVPGYEVIIRSIQRTAKASFSRIHAVEFMINTLDSCEA